MPAALSGQSCPLRDEEVELTVTSVVPQYRDGALLNYSWTFGGSYKPYKIYSYEDKNDKVDPSVPADGVWHYSYSPYQPPKQGPWGVPTESGYERITDAPGCQVWQKIDPPPQSSGGTPSYYATNWFTTNGSWSAKPGQAGYIDPQTLEVTPAQTLSSGGYTWTLVPPEGISGVPCDTKGTICNIAPGKYPSDTFWYPGKSDTNRPHAWSYVKRLSNPGGDWPMSAQPPIGPPDPGPYFYPAQVGGEGANISGNDHIVFVNLPEGNDTSMANKEAIKRYISLERYSQHPRYTNYDYTTMPFTSSIAPNTTQAESWGAGGGKATPLAASLRWAKRYFESYITQDAQSLIHCRQNFIILLTDGLDTADCNPASSDYQTCLTDENDPRSPAQAAKALREIRIGDDSYEVKTYVVGFGLDRSQAGALDAVARAGGTGQARFAQDSEALARQLSSIFQEIGSNYYTRSDLTITREGDRLFMAYFEYPGWKGHLAKFSIKSENGSVERCQSDDPTCREWGGTGDAGDALNSQALRVVYTTVETGLNPTRIRFSPEEASRLKGNLLEPSDDINQNGVPYEDEDARTVIQFILDPYYQNGKYLGTRAPRWKLSDLYHTRPVVVGKPSFDYTFNDYPTFKDLLSERDTVIYVGSNGGMLHAIKARKYEDCDPSTPGNEICDDSGEERWAYVPKLALRNLKNLRIEHEFFVDSRPSVSDVYVQGGSGSAFSSPGWRTVLVSGMREGGRGYFALDVTDPDDPKVLWEYTDGNMGYTWSVPAIGRVKLGTSERWVAIVGGGWTNPNDPANNDVGNRLYMIDIETGDLLRDGSQTSEWQIGSSTNRVPSAIKAVDMNGDGYIDRVYFGDTSGVMWKMDLTSSRIRDWVPCKLFDPQAPNWNSETLDRPVITPRPIFYEPAVVKGDSGNYLVLFGTGDEIRPTTTTTYDYFYEVEDKSVAPSGSPPSCAGQINWAVRLPQGEKVLSRPSVYNRIVYFTTYSPSGQCGAGTGYLWGLTTSRGLKSTGGGQAGIVFGEEGEELGTPISKREIGAGVPTAPLVTHGMIYVTTSNLPRNPLEGLPPIVTQRINPVSSEIRGWREVFE